MNPSALNLPGKCYAPEPYLQGRLLHFVPQPSEQLPLPSCHHCYETKMLTSYHPSDPTKSNRNCYNLPSQRIKQRQQTIPPPALLIYTTPATNQDQLTATHDNKQTQVEMRARSPSVLEDHEIEARLSKSK